MWRCKHYSVQFGGTQDHLFSYEVGTGLYDVEYFEALFDENTEEIAWIENTMMDLALLHCVLPQGILVPSKFTFMS